MHRMEEKMKKPCHLFVSVLSITLFLGSIPLALAADYGKGGDTSGAAPQQGAVLPDKMAKPTPEAKINLAPHGVMIQTSLMSALDQVKGMKAQLDVSDTPNKETTAHIKKHELEMKSDLRTAFTHQFELQSGIKKYPQIAQSDNFKSTDMALSDVKKASQSWMSKSSNAEYWKNKSQAKSDLDQLEKKINSAIDQTNDFNKSQLDITAFG
jgi:hypothetical protein